MKRRFGLLSIKGDGDEVSKNFRYILWIMVILYAGSMRDISAQDISLKIYSLESVTKVEQQHNPALGANTLHLSIDGRSNGKPMNVGISFNSSGWGGTETHGFLREKCDVGDAIRIVTN